MSLPIENKEFWIKHLEAQKASGLSRSHYCRTNNINYHRFGYWMQRLFSVAAAFVPVKLEENVTSSINSALCTIELRGHTISIYDLSALKLVLERLA
jgi:hypothetical protein